MNIMRKTAMPDMRRLLAAGTALSTCGIAVRNEATITEKDLKAVSDELKRITDDVKANAEKVFTEIKNTGKLSEETKATVDKLLTEQNAVRATFEARMTDVEQKLARQPGEGEPEKRKTAGQIVIENEALAAFIKNGVRGYHRIPIPIKNAMMSQDLGAGIIEPQRDPLLTRLRSRFFIRDLINKGRTSSNSIQYLRQTGFTNNAAVVSEGALKPESTITYDLVSANVATIAHIFKASKQILDDFPRLQSDVDSELRYGLKRAEENEILFGDGTGIHLHGIVPQAAAYAPAFAPALKTLIDDVRLAMLQSQLALIPATAIVMHFTDWARIELTKDTTGGYIFANPQSLAGPNLWGLPVAATDLTAMEDHFLVGGFQEGATLYDREDINVQIATENEDDFVKNMITIRCEERLALAVKRPEAFVYGTFYQVSGS